jgi:NADH dehydrogenase
LVIGAGFAGMWSALSAARLLSLKGHDDGSIEVALVAPDPVLHVRPRLYENDPIAFQVPLLDIFDAVGVQYIQGSVERIRAVDHEVDVVDAGGDTFILGYDRLVLASGSKLFRPDIPGLHEHAFSVDQTADAARLAVHIDGLKDRPYSEARNTVVVAGGGFTGLETAAEMPARLCATLGGDANINVVIVERAGEIGPDLGPGPRPVILEALNDLGVAWRLGASVTSVDADGITTSSGERIAAKTVIWTAGVRASSLTEQLQAKRDPLGRLHVDRNLRVIGSEDIFAAGDVAYAPTDDLGNHATMSCQHAMNLGRSAGNNAAADLLGVTSNPYSQPKYVTCLDLGPWGAVYTEGWDREVKLVGAEAKRLKHQINSEWIYPPRADKAEILEAADPARIVVA